MTDPPAAATIRSWTEVAAAELLVLGDSHGTSRMVTRAIEQAAARGSAGLVSVGDFGIWPGDHGRWFMQEVTVAARHVEMPVVVVAGNHDDYDQIDAAPRTDDGWIELSDWVLAAPRGHVWEVAGRPWMAFGGAASIDGPGGAFPQVRGPVLEGDSFLDWDGFGQPRRRRATTDLDFGNWWRRERITKQDVERATAAATALQQPVDVLVTHDVPSCIDLSAWKNGLEWEPGEQQRRRIQQVADAAAPTVTVSGHWHRFLHRRPEGGAGAEQIVLAADISEDGAQWVTIRSARDERPDVEEFGRIDRA